MSTKYKSLGTQLQIANAYLYNAEQRLADDLRRLAQMDRRIAQGCGDKVALGQTLYKARENMVRMVEQDRADIAEAQTRIAALRSQIAHSAA